MPQHHEMQRLEQPLVDRRGGILGDPQHVAHRVAVSREREPSLRVSAQRGLVVDGGHDVIQAGVVSLDAVRALDSAGEGHAAQGPEPPTGLRINVGVQLLAEILDHREDL